MNTNRWSIDVGWASTWVKIVNEWFAATIHCKPFKCVYIYIYIFIMPFGICSFIVFLFQKVLGLHIYFQKVYDEYRAYNLGSKTLTNQTPGDQWCLTLMISDNGSILTEQQMRREILSFNSHYSRSLYRIRTTLICEACQSDRTFKKLPPYPHLIVLRLDFSFLDLYSRPYTINLLIRLNLLQCNL